MRFYYSGIYPLRSNIVVDTGQLCVCSLEVVTKYVLIGLQLDLLIGPTVGFNVRIDGFPFGGVLPLAILRRFWFKNYEYIPQTVEILAPA